MEALGAILPAAAGGAAPQTPRRENRSPWSAFDARREPELLLQPETSPGSRPGVRVGGANLVCTHTPPGAIRHATPCPQSRDDARRHLSQQVILSRILLTRRCVPFHPRDGQTRAAMNPLHLFVWPARCGNSNLIKKDRKISRVQCPVGRTPQSSTYKSLTCVFIGCYPTPGSYGIRKVFPCKSAIGSEVCRAGLTKCDPIEDKIDVKHVYTEVDFAIGSQFIRHALEYTCKETSSEHHTARTTLSHGCAVFVRRVFNTTSQQHDSADLLLSQYQLGSPLVDDRPIMNAVKYKVVSGVVWTNRTMLWGAEVAKPLDCSSFTKANRVQSPAGPLPDLRKWESCRTMTLVGGFLKGSPVSPVLPFRRKLHTHLNSLSSALKTSLLRAAQISSLTHS
ncbi:hypothetical protein PR048_030715 [Dryococelus australis]|uniref:Uncharacterized protein n=1 Tax=Dryococelus australis TaxID=614101 RepID=A0ABQ9GAG2_9NEOP|nr:hypothetical protein PR048_030715 [Dryococelus australis]